MSDLGNLVVRLQLDYSQYDSDLNSKKADTERLAKDLAASFRKTALSITPKVDDSALTRLNQHLELKRTHFQSVQRYFNTQPLTPKVDVKELEKLKTEIANLPSKISVDIETQIKNSVKVSLSGLVDGSRLADDIGKSVAKYSKGSLLGRIAKAPLNLAGFATRSVAEGALFSIGGALSKQLGLGKVTKAVTDQLKKYSDNLTEYAGSLDDYLAEFLANLVDATEGQDFKVPETRYQRDLANLAKMGKVATVTENPSNIKDIEELYRLIPKEKRESFNQDPSKFLAQNTKIRKAILQRSDSLIKELAPTDLVNLIVNPILKDLSAPFGFVNKVQNIRTVREAGKLAKNRKLPDLSEDQEGYIQMIGGAMFRKGHGDKSLQSAFEGMFPGRRVIGVKNPDTDPTGEPISPLAKGIFTAIKTLNPEITSNKELGNTLINAITMFSQSVDPTHRSTAVTESLANILAAKMAGLSDDQISTVSYSLGGQELSNLASLLDEMGIASKNLALAFPDMNFSGKVLPNFQSTTIEEDPLAFAKNVLGLGSSVNHKTFETGIPKTAEAHAYQHYFKNPNQVEDFYKFLGVNRGSSTGNQNRFLQNSSTYYETMGSVLQANSLLDTGELDTELPIKAFAGVGESTTKGLFAKILEQADKTPVLDGLSDEQKAIQIKLKESVLASYQKLVQKLIDEGDNISPDVEPSELYGRLKYNDELDSYNANIRAFTQGDTNDPDKQYFAANLDPVEIQARQVDIKKAQSFFKRQIPDSSPYKTKLLELFDNIKALGDEYIATGSISEESKAKYSEISPDRFPAEIEKIFNKKFNQLDFPEMATDSNESFLEKYLDYKPLAQDLKKQRENIPVSKTELLDQPSQLSSAIQTTKDLAVGALEAGSKIVAVGEAIVNSDPAKAIVKVTKQLYEIADGIESAAFSMNPLGGKEPLKALKVPIRNVGLFAASTHLPGVEGAAELLSAAIEGAATTPIAGALGMAGEMVTNAAAPITNTLGHLPGMGGLTAELGASVAAGSQNVAGLIGGGIADIATPLLGGGLVAKGIEATGNAVLPDVGSQKQLSGQVEQKLLRASSELRKTVQTLQYQMKELEAAKNKAKKLLPSGSTAGTAYLDVVNKQIPSLEATINTTIASIPVGDERGTREFAQIANIKQRLGKVVADVTKLSEDNKKKSYSKSVNRTIDVTATESVDLDKYAKASVKELGSRFKKSAEAIPVLLKDQTANSTEAAKDIARGILLNVEKARAEIDALLKSSSDISPELKKAVGTTRGQITRSEKTAKSVLSDDDSIDIGGNVASGIAAGIENSISDVTSAAHMLSSTLIDTTKDDLEIHSPSEVFKRLGEFIVEGLDRGLAIGENLKLSFLDPILDFARQNIQWFPDLEDQALSLLKTFGSLAGLGAIVAVFQSIGSAAIDTAREFEKFEVGINFASRGSGAAKRNIAELEEQISDLNVDMRSAYEGFTGILASTKETPLENFAGDINNSLLQAAAVYQLDPESAHRMYLATQQIASKGTVSSEEIKLQLGEVLPGAYNIAARSMGMSTSEFAKALERGDVKSSEFLPRFSQQLSSETEIAANTISETSTGKINAFNNSITKLQLTVGKGILPVANLGLDVLNSALKGVTDNVDFLVQGFRFLVAVLGATLLKSIMGFIKGLFVARTAMFSVGQAASFVGGMLGKLTARFLIFTAVTDTLSLIWQSFQDGSGVIKEFADTSVKNLEAYKKAVIDAQNAGSPAQKAANRPTATSIFDPNYSKKNSISGKSDFEETIIGQVLDKFSGMIGSDQSVARQIENSIGLVFGTGKVQRGYKDTLKNTDTVFQNNDYIATEIERLFQDPTSDLNKTIDIDNQIEAINKKKRALNPNDKVGIRELQAQEDDLIKQREVPFDSIGKMSSTLQTQIEGIQTTLKELDELDASGGITGDEYLKRTTKLKADLEKLRTLQDDFNKAIKGGVSQAQLLEMEFNRLVAAQKDAMTQIDLRASQNQAKISDAQASGDISKVQADFSKISAQQDALRQKIEANNKALAQSQTVLNNPNVQEALTRYNLQGQGSESIGAFITNRSLQQSEFKDSKDGKILAVAQNSVAQNEQLQREIAESQGQLSEQRLQTQESVRDLSRALFDFYRSAADTADDLSQTVQETNLETEVVKAKNRLNSKLKGFSNRFFGELTSQLSDLIDTLFEPLRNSLNAQNQIRGYQKQLRDQLQAGNDMIAQYQPGGAGIPGATGQPGSAVASGLYTAPQANNGGSAEYHIDTKFNRSLDWDQIVKMFDQLAAGYRQQGRQIMFSNEGVNGEVYDETRSAAEKAALLRRVDAAHDHSVSQDFYSLDYYIPNRGEGLHSQSVENAEMLVPTLPGMNLEYGSGGRYGNYVAGVVNDQVLFKQGHGDDSRPLPQNRTIGTSTPVQAPTNVNQASQPAVQATANNVELIRLATLAVLESPSRQGRIDVAANVGNRLAGGQWGNTITDVAFAEGQYAPYFNYQPSDISSLEDAVNILVNDRGYTRDTAMQAIQTFFGDLANPQMLQNSINFVGGRQYFKGVDEYANRVPSEDPLRHHGENYYHIESGQSYDELRGYQQGSIPILNGIASQISGGGSPATAVSQNGVRLDPSVIQGGNNLVRAGVDSAIAATQSQLEALDEQAAIKLKQTIEQIKRTQRDGVEELTDTAIAERRRLEDLQVAGEQETPELNLQVSLRDVDRQQEDATRDLTRTIREAKEGLEILEAAKAEITALGVSNPQVLELIPGLEENINTTQQRIAQLEATYNQFSEVFDANRRKIAEDFARAEAEREFAYQSTRRGIESQVSDQLAQDYTLRGDGRSAINQRETESVRATNFDVDSRIRDLEEQLRTRAINQDQFDNTKRSLEEYRRLALDNIGRSAENERDEFDVTQSEAMGNSRIGLFQAQAEQLESRGMSRQARDIQKQIRLEQQNLDFSSQLADLEKMAESGQYAAETIDRLRQNLFDLNDIKLEGIAEEFDTGAQILKNFQNASKTALADLILGATSAQEVLVGLLNTMASSLANMASDFLLSEIFGIFSGGALGGRGKGKETGTTNFLGDALGIGLQTGLSLFTAKVGGEVPNMDMGSLRDRPDAIGKALRKEGSSSVLAALTPGELVLSVEKARKYNSLGLDRVLNFKEGGMVGFASPKFSPNLRQGDINIPVSVSGNSGGSGGLDVGRLRESVRVAVVEELNYQNRPRGIGYN